MDQTETAKTPIVVLSHGNLAQALLDSASMVFGAEAREDTYAFCLQPEEDPDDYLARVQAVLSKLPEDTLLLIDMYGGTPFNTVFKLSRERIPYAITGVSMPLLLEALGLRGFMHGQELLDAVFAQAGECTVNFTEKVRQHRQSS